jgi:hypothetical protein
MLPNLRENAQTLRGRVEVLEPERMNLLGLMLAGILERRLDGDPGLRGDVFIEAGAMQVTLCFSDRGVVVSRGPAGRPIAHVRGTLGALLDCALGRGRVRAVLGGQLHVWGRPLSLFRLLRLLRS